MKSSLKILSAIMFGIMNVMGADNKIKLFYDGLLNKTGSDISALNSFMNNFADGVKYCDYTQGVPQCSNKDELKTFINDEYFRFNDLTAQQCNIIKQYGEGSFDIDCKFTSVHYSSPQTKSNPTTRYISRSEHIDYDPNGAVILQYYLLSFKETSVSDGKRRLTHNYWAPTQKPVDKCYDTTYNSPCTAENIASGNFYFASCHSCCYFVQCDESGHAFDRPCAPGTFWDQTLLTCNHNRGQCRDNNCPAPTPRPTPAPTKSTATKSPTPCDGKCYDTMYKNPCSPGNRLAGNFYFPSCTSCCNFIQCDAFGVAFDRPCAPGTFWDQDVLTCNHNRGQCKDDQCLTPPTESPTITTTKWPTKAPTTKAPSKWPTKYPTTKTPSKWPTKAPTTTQTPTKSPSTKTPSKWPTPSPTTTRAPTKVPTKAPTTKEPTKWPTKAPTTKTPTKWPTKYPTTKEPTNWPTQAPTGIPTKSPSTKTPSKWPTPSPTTTQAPTKSPTTKEPTKWPTKAPTTKTLTNWPTKYPTTKTPSKWPTPSPITTQAPTKSPTTKTPTKWPTTKTPTKWPTLKRTTTTTTTERPTKWAPCGRSNKRKKRKKMSKI